MDLARHHDERAMDREGNDFARLGDGTAAAKSSVMRSHLLGSFVLSLMLLACGDAASSSPSDPTPVATDDAGWDLPTGAWDAGVSADGACAATSFKTKPPTVDIVLGIDTSDSMGNEMAQVKANLNAFAQAIGKSGIDYQVILLAPRGTGSSQMCVPAPLGGAACADNPPSFHQVEIQLGGHSGMTGILSTYDSADPKQGWQKWARPAAHKVIMYVTDADSEITAASFDAQLLAKAPSGMFGTANARKYTFDTICGWQDGTPYASSNACSTASKPGKNYQQLALLTKGLVDSVCKPSFDGVFKNLASGVTAKLGCTFDLPSSKDPIDTGKVAVTYTAGTGTNKGQTATLTHVTDASKCAANPDGWYYDDPTNPAKVILCPAQCTVVGADTSAAVDVAVGCAVPPPK